jgi:hypothetical protein
MILSTDRAPARAQALFCALATGWLLWLGLLGRVALRVWRAEDYLDSHAALIGPYLASRLARPWMLAAAVAAALAVWAIARQRAARPIVARWAWLFAVLLGAELAVTGWAAYQLRAPVDRLVSALRLRDEAFFRLWDLSLPALRPVADAVAAGRNEEAGARLLAFLRERLARRERSEFDGRDTARILETAEQAVARTVTVREITRTLSEDLDWATGLAENREWAYFLNRMGWLPALGKAYHLTRDPRYAAAFTRYVQDWLADNPLPRWKDETHHSWRLIEASRRLRDSWIEAFGWFADAPEVPDALRLALLKSIHDHAQFLTRFRTHSNHVLTESTGLLETACAFPEFARARDWKRVALDRLWQEAAQQIYPDGGHAELTFGYHLLCLTHFAVPLTLAERCAIQLPPGYAERLRAMARFARFTQRPDGQTPLLNDTNPERVDETLARLAAAAPLLRESGGGSPGRSAAFPYSGYYVMGSDWTPQARYLIFDAGGYGGFHGHEDKLSFELSAFGTPMLTDAGAYAYTGEPAYRAYFVGTAAHNTVMLDGLGQNRYRDRRHRRPIPAPRAKPAAGVRWVSTEAYDAVSGVYDEGYAPAGAEGRGHPGAEIMVRHTRRILFVKPDYWLLVDELDGTGVHDVEQLFHFPAGAQAAVEDGAVHAGYPNGAALQLVPLDGAAPEWSLIEGATDPIQGWVATAYAKKLPAPVAIARRRVALPAALYTGLFPRQARAMPPVACAREAAPAGAARFGIAGENWRDVLAVSREAPAGIVVTIERRLRPDAPPASVRTEPF